MTFSTPSRSSVHRGGSALPDDRGHHRSPFHVIARVLFLATIFGAPWAFGAVQSWAWGALTVVAFAGGKEFNLFKHGIIPALGVITNIIMVLAIFIIGIRSGGISAQATYLALGVSAGWLVISVIYFIATSARTGKAILPATTVISSND